MVPSAAICPAAESGVSVPWTRGRWVPATSVLQAGFHPTTVLRVCPVVDRRILGKALGGPVTRHLQVSCWPACLLWRGQLNNACAERDSVGFAVAVSLLQGSRPSVFNITQSCRLANAGRLDCVMGAPNGMGIRRHATRRAIAWFTVTVHRKSPLSPHTGEVMETSESVDECRLPALYLKLCWALIAHVPGT